MNVSFFLGLLSCSKTTPKKAELPPLPQVNLTCDKDQEETVSRHLILSAKTDMTFKDCIRNYMKVEPNPYMDFSFCTRLSVGRDGKVKSVQIYQSNLPRSLHWCVEQQLWSRDFSALPLKRSVIVSYPT